MKIRDAASIIAELVWNESRIYYEVTAAAWILVACIVGIVRPRCFCCRSPLRRCRRQAIEILDPKMVEFAIYLNYVQILAILVLVAEIKQARPNIGFFSRPDGNPFDAVVIEQASRDFLRTTGVRFYPTGPVGTFDMHRLDIERGEAKFDLALICLGERLHSLREPDPVDEGRILQDPEYGVPQ
mmetsp:Transcript_7919/g.24921  ORF Transcript_7919/g.24921 Transcript_7919/m.24921 type:complete len:184 (-) Transcript_7919:3-554(-)